MPDQLFFKFLSEAFPALTEAQLSERWETHAKIPWSSLPTEAKLEWAQVATLARICASFENFEEMITAIRTLQR